MCFYIACLPVNSSTSLNQLPMFPELNPPSQTLTLMKSPLEGWGQKRNVERENMACIYLHNGWFVKEGRLGCKERSGRTCLTIFCVVASSFEFVIRAPNVRSFFWNEGELTLMKPVLVLEKTAFKYLLLLTTDCIKKNFWKQRNFLVTQW